jgi:DNA replication protein
MKVDSRLVRNIDWKTLLLETYRDMSLSEEHVMIILMTDYCLIQGDRLVTADLLSLKMSLDYKKIDQLFAELMNKGLINLVTEEDGLMSTSITSLKELLIDAYVRTYIKDKTKPEKTEKSNDNLIAIFETEFGRPLSYLEIQTIRKWFEEGYQEAQILNALKTATGAKVKNIRYIDKILLEWRQQEERESEGYTTITDKWRKDIEESMKKIADINWVDKNGKK